MACCTDSACPGRVISCVTAGSTETLLTNLLRRASPVLITMDDEEGAQLVADFAIFITILFLIAIVTSTIGLIRRCWLMWPTWRPGALPSPSSAEFEGVTLVLMPLPAEIKARAERQLSTADGNEVKTPSFSQEDNKPIVPEQSGYNYKKAQLRLYIKAEVEEKLRRDLEKKQALFKSSLYDAIYIRDA